MWLLTALIRLMYPPPRKTPFMFEFMSLVSIIATLRRFVGPPVEADLLNLVLKI